MYMLKYFRIWIKLCMIVMFLYVIIFMLYVDLINVYVKIFIMYDDIFDREVCYYIIICCVLDSMLFLVVFIFVFILKGKKVIKIL